ncbi:mediator of RNA polymerase II transcription subunit 8-like protein [Euroglyphus maynei]|uniref:Mediator of RNA polymerase II transcription subunit 8 n=1 Tax=Euroglyphus maynei TaxID=6958 RepID=A0A1Y3AR27_EURMA|nr:mediator of RNA polymerase II transcription subunit 8-like protein [Euroglyphus maynei]
MDREDRQFEMVLDSLLQRSQDLMKALSLFMNRTDNEQLEYNHYADAFASFQGYLKNILKVVRSHSQNLAIRTVFPLKLAPNEDEMLINATEGRLRSLNHDTAPIYLRTKLEPELENRLNLFATKGNSINNDQAQKQIQTANKISQNMVDLIRSHKEEWENDSRNPIPQTYSQADTYQLSAAIFNGKGLRSGSEMISSGQKLLSGSGNNLSGSAPTGVASPLTATGHRNAPGKAQPSIKTQIKAATSIHPYR